MAKRIYSAILFLAICGLLHGQSSEGGILQKIGLKPYESGLEIRLTLNKPIVHRSFKLTDPNRLVIDLYLVQNFYCDPYIDVMQAGVQSIRVGNFTPDVVRVVFDFVEKPPQYSITKEDVDIVVTFLVEKEPEEIKRELPEELEQEVPKPREEEIEKPVEVRPERILPRPKKKYQIEIFGGFAVLEPRDLNLRGDYEAEFLDFFYDGLFSYYQTNGLVLSYTTTHEGAFPRIERSVPIGLRLRMNLNRNLGLSLGVKYFSTREASSMTVSYVSEWSTTRLDIDSSYSPFEMYTKGFIPQLGVHFGSTFSSLGFEAYLAGGLVLAQCGYSFAYDFRQAYGWGYTYTSKIQAEEAGSGTGYSLEAGGRLSVDIGGVGGLFVEGGYALQKVDRLSGEGSYDWQQDHSNGEPSNDQSSWTGEWGVVNETHAFNWGSKDMSYPTSQPQALADKKARDFSLDLSGVQLRAGLYFRF